MSVDVAGFQIWRDKNQEANDLSIWKAAQAAEREKMVKLIQDYAKTKSITRFLTCSEILEKINE